MSRAPTGTAPRKRTSDQGRKSAWYCDITDVVSPVCPHTRSNPITRRRQSSRSPATSRVYTSRFHAPPVARRHVNALPTKAAQIHMVLQHHGRNLATRSAHTLQAIISHDTGNRPAHQRHAAFTPACVALPSGAAPRKRTFHQGRMALRHHERHFATRSAHTLEAILSHDTANHPAHQRHTAFTPACFALPSGKAPCKRTFHQGRANPHGTATSRT